MNNLRDCRDSVSCKLKKTVTVPVLRWTITWWMILVCGCAAVLAGITGIASTNRSVFCITCHEMNVHYNTWKVSSHKGVECEQCHISPGVVSMAKSKIAAMRQVYHHVKGNVK